MNPRKHYPDRPKAVYFFGTCLIDIFYPEAGMAGIQLIQREGVRVSYPPDQTCCGQPAYNSGYRDEAKAVAKAQIGLFSEGYPVVVPSGSCASMMRHHWLELFRGDPMFPVVQTLAERIFELTEFLVRVLKLRLDDKGHPIRVALHTSCHSLREMGVAPDEKQLVDQLQHVELVEHEHKHECCGFGGVFSMKYPEISATMVQDKVAAIAAAEPNMVVSGDCGCLMNITGALEYQGRSLPGQHIASFLWERVNDQAGD
jgi:L-lactate dehydrogenase complex protein LldE